MEEEWDEAGDCGGSQVRLLLLRIMSSMLQPSLLFEKGCDTCTHRIHETNGITIPSDNAVAPIKL